MPLTLAMNRWVNPQPCGTLLLMLTLLLTACGAPSPSSELAQRVIGTWKLQHITTPGEQTVLDTWDIRYQFNADRTVTITAASPGQQDVTKVDGTYDLIDATHLRITVDGSSTVIASEIHAAQVVNTDTQVQVSDERLILTPAPEARWEFTRAQ